MTCWKVFLILTILLASINSNGQNDTLTIVDEFDKSRILVSKKDFISELSSVLEDSIKNELIKHVSSIQDSLVLYNQYFTHDSITYQNSLDSVLFNLFNQNKMMFQVGNELILPEQIKVKIIRVHHCFSVIGKDYGLYYNKVLIASFEKSRNRKAYRTCTPF
jgi:hypothetical protein